MLSTPSDREVAEEAIKFIEQTGEEGRLRDAFDRLMVDVETLQILEGRQVCGRCPITQVAKSAAMPRKRLDRGSET